MTANNRYKISQLKAFSIGSPNYTNFTGQRNEYSVNCYTPNQNTTYSNSNTINKLPDSCGYAAFNLNSTDGDSSQATQ